MRFWGLMDEFWKVNLTVSFSVKSAPTTVAFSDHSFHCTIFFKEFSDFGAKVNGEEREHKIIRMKLR